MMNVLITGGSSAIGLAVAELIVSAGGQCRLFDTVVPSHVPDNTEFFAGDVRDLAALSAAAAGCDSGVHLAVVAEQSSDANMLSVNVTGAWHFLSVARALGFKRSLIIGSAPVHLPLVKADDGPLFPTASDNDHLYDLTKILQEVVAADFQHHGLPVCCMRLGHVVRGLAQTNLKGREALRQVSYCRGGWVALEDVAVACYQVLQIEALAAGPLNLVGASPGYEAFRVDETERMLGVKLQYRFSEY
jgi:nucleoside-diphosphate-sugar epimerase